MKYLKEQTKTNYFDNLTMYDAAQMTIIINDFVIKKLELVIKIAKYNKGITLEGAILDQIDLLKSDNDDIENRLKNN